MLFKTSGIVINTVNYTDSSLIVKIYTLEFGLQSYIVSGSRSKKSKTKATLFQPLAIIDIEVTNNSKNKIQRLQETNIAYNYSSIYNNIYKNVIVLFLNEMLYKSLKEDHSNEELFDFIKSFLMLLDVQAERFSNFSIYFLLQLTKHLGFFPHGSYSNSASYFDLKEGNFIQHPPIHPYSLDVSQSELLSKFINTNIHYIETIELTRLQRKTILESLIIYYKLHIENFGEIKSLKILEEIIS